MTSDMKRYLVYPFDFDSRAAALDLDTSGWNDEQRRQHEERRNQARERLGHEYGARDLERKFVDFIALGSRPFSIVSYHNGLYHSACNAFIQGLYYPALTAACALGERILNHLILDLRDDYAHTSEYQSVKRKQSFDNWRRACDVLSNWQIFQTDTVAEEFVSLMKLRHQSLHFNVASYKTLREDALQALRHLAEIIRSQFGFAGQHKWQIKGTAGQFFIKKECETEPFMRRYYLPQCPQVGPLFAIQFVPGGILFFDKAYPDTQITDEEFARLYMTRDPAQVVSSELPPVPGVTIQARPHGAPVAAAEYREQQ
jgi:hypothetical protein